MSKKIKLIIDKVEYQLPINAYVAKPTYGGTPYIHMSAKHTASIIKQFVKRFFPEVKVWSKSQTYSGGSSVNVSLSNSDGSSIHQNIYEQISEFSNKFKAGSFNGMEDIYEYNNNDVLTDNGTKLDYFPSYVFCKNAPEWGTIEYWVNEYNEFKFMTPEHPNYDTYIAAVEKAGGWLSMNKTYMTDKEFSNVKLKLNIA
jgi:hypothetical protein|tara:strand:+ start:813 stop:1409 length:597 start_codon:yes stop_codon:yes gene_type:complete